MLKNLSLAIRLGLGFGLIVVVFNIVCAVTYVHVGAIKEGATTVGTVNIPKQEKAVDMLTNVLRMRIAMMAMAADQGDRSQTGAEFRNVRADLLASITDLENMLKKNSTPEEVDPMKIIRGNIDLMIPLQDSVMNRTTTNQAETVATLGKYNAGMVEAVNKMVKLENELSGRETVKAMDEIKLVSTVLITSSIMGTIISFLIAFIIARSVTQPVMRIVKVVNGMAEGDFSRAIVAESKDEVGILQMACGRMRESLLKMIDEVHVSAEQLVGSATDLSSAANNVRKSSEQQSESASAMAAALEEMTTSISQVAALSDDARKNSAEAGEIANTGSGTIHSMVGEISQMADAVSEGAVKSQQLGKDSERISSIIHVIRDVADQTNLLALNAAIEAARAGEHGRGFAVVADEVRKLAEKTTASAQEITEMVGAIQSGSNAMSSQMETTSHQMQEGVELAKKAGDTISEITTSAQNVVHMIDEVTNALKEQEAASQDIAKRVEQIVQMVEENSSAIGTVAESSGHLNSLAVALRNSTNRFRTA